MVVSGHRSFLGVSDLGGPRKAVPPRGAGRPGHAASTEAHRSGRRPSSAAGGPVARLSWSHSLAALHLYLTHPRRCPFLSSSARACHLASPRTVTGGDAEWPGRWVPVPQDVRARGPRGAATARGGATREKRLTRARAPAPACSRQRRSRQTDGGNDRTSTSRRADKPIGAEGSIKIFDF